MSARVAQILGVLLVVGALAFAFGDDLARLVRGDPFEADGVVSTHVDGMEVRAVLRPDPPRQRGTTLHLLVTTPDGDPVDGAHVEVEVMMPQMGAMPEMRSVADVEALGGGRYAATFDLEMGGGWTIELELHAPGGRTASLRYTFTVGTAGLNPLARGAPALPTPPADVVPDHAFSDASLGPLREALQAYDGIRRALLADTTEDVATLAGAVAVALETAEPGAADAPAAVREHLRQARAAARVLAEADDVDAARDATIPLSRHLIALAAADERLAEGLRVKACPMVPGTPRWIEPEDAPVGNPYMGSSMPGCAIDAAWEADEDAPAPAGDDDTVYVDPIRQQRFGVTTEEVRLRTLSADVLAPGVVALDERGRAAVTVRAAGWVERLLVEEEGVRVRAGQPLAEVYSPEVFAAWQELRLGTVSGVDPGPLTDAARTRLRLLGVDDASIDAALAGAEPPRTVTVRAPVGGVVWRKAVVQGQRVEPGVPLYELADAGRVWVEAAIYEHQLPLVGVGLSATITSDALPGRRLRGRVTLVAPEVDRVTRTATVRVELDGPAPGLLPGAWTTVRFERFVGPTLAVPQDAVIHAGTRRIVFVDRGEGVLAPRLVEIGQRGDGWYEVLSGLRAGERVVASGVFLIAAESRLGNALRFWGPEVSDDAR